MQTHPLSSGLLYNKSHHAPRAISTNEFYFPYTTPIFPNQSPVRNGQPPKGDRGEGEGGGLAVCRECTTGQGCASSVVGDANVSLRAQIVVQHIATHCSALQHTATHCNTLQHSVTHCNTLEHTALEHTETHWNTPQQGVGVGYVYMYMYGYMFKYQWLFLMFFFTSSWCLQILS